LWITKNLH